MDRASEFRVTTENPVVIMVRLCSEADSINQIEEVISEQYCELSNPVEWQLTGVVILPDGLTLTDSISRPAAQAELVEHSCSYRGCTEVAHSLMATTGVPGYDLDSQLPDSQFEITFRDGLFILEGRVEGDDLTGVLQWHQQGGPNGFRLRSGFRLEFIAGQEVLRREAGRR